MTDEDASTIHQDVPEVDADAELFLKKFSQPAEATTEKVIDEKVESEEAEQAVEDTEADAEAEEAEQAEEEEIEADDKAVVKVKAGDKELKLTVAELKRLAGQEAELTRKSQAVSEVTKRAEEQSEKALALTDAMVRRVEHEWKERGYDKVDLVLAAKNLPEDAYRVLKSDMQALAEQHRYLSHEGQALVEQVRQARQAEHQKQAATVDANMAQRFPGWTKELRSEVIKYAKEQGFPESLADNIVDPASLSMIHKAYLYERGTQAVKAKVKPVAASAPKSLRPGATGDNGRPDPRKAAMADLKRSGSVDDAANAFLARFGG